MSDTRDMRLFAQWLDDPQKARLAIDVRLDRGRIVASWDIFGAVDLDGDAPRPFILRRDGRIEFAANDAWRTDLRDGEIRVGAVFRVWFNSVDVGDYRIVKIAALGAKEMQ